MTQLTEKLEKDAIDIDSLETEIQKKNEEVNQLTQALEKQNQSLLAVTNEKDFLME